jgi:phosphoserine phosphatase
MRDSSPAPPQRPSVVLELDRSLRRGAAAFKRAVASRVDFDPSLLPYNQELLSYLSVQKRAGRRIGLFTAADRAIAEKIAAYLGIFDVVCASNGAINLAGARKVAAIKEAFGDRFVYAGNSAVDRPIFDAAERVILVGPVERLQRSVSNGQVIEAIFLASALKPSGYCFAALNESASPASARAFIHLASLRFLTSGAQ